MPVTLNEPNWILTAFAIVVLFPMAIAGAVLRRLGSDSGMGVFVICKDHPRNFGGNAAEVSPSARFDSNDYRMALKVCTAAALSLRE